VKLQHLGPVFTRRGPREQQVAFRVTDLGADTAFPGSEDGPPWSKSFPWSYVAEVSVGAAPDGALLFVDSYRFRFPERSVDEIGTLVAPYLTIVGTEWFELGGPPSVLRADVTVENRVDLAGGDEVWHSDWLAHDHGDLVEASAEWISRQPGVEGVIHNDISVIVVGPAVRSGLKEALKAWWIEKIDGVELGW
jgi:hypothetical protein